MKSYNDDNLNSASDSSSSSPKESSQTNTLTESDSSDDEPVIKRKKSQKARNEKDEIMKLIKNNPEDFGLRRSSRADPVRGSALSESSSESNSDESESSDDSIPASRKRYSFIRDLFHMIKSFL